MPTRPKALPETDADRASAPAASFAALVDALPLAVAVFDADLELVAANERYRELTGLAAGQAVNRSMRDAFPNALGDLSPQIEAAANGCAPAPARVAFRRGAGERLVDVTFTPLGAGPDSGVVFAGADVTERDE
ncbi:MAG: PAS domain-containing protein, partial [Gemmatimonadota bacterium]|nr:PAS domain-containing protein [Gemmatimonadota bacterium]